MSAVAKTRPEATARWIAPRNGGYRPGGEFKSPTDKAGTKVPGPKGTGGVSVKSKGKPS